MILKPSKFYKHTLTGEKIATGEPCVGRYWNDGEVLHAVRHSTNNRTYIGVTNSHYYEISFHEYVKK